jgi:outer membrane receptor protein involved in Fe transport
MPGVAIAQTDPQSDTSAPAAPAGAPAASDKAGDIVITGSRITRKDYVAESPIVTVSKDTIQNSGPSTLDEVLNTLPQFAATAGDTNGNVARGSRSNANLRGLGISRTLVLLDGRRLQPSDSLGAIDLNVLPSAVIGDVEVITGGASAVYGSDAIAGVVNFKTRKDFSGLDLDGQYAETERGDGRTFDLSGTFGGKFNDGRGTALFSVSYMDRDEVQRGTRPFFQNAGIAAVLPTGLILANGTNLPTQASIDSVFARYGITSTISRGATFSVNPDGTLYTTSTPVANFKPGSTLPYIIINGQVGNPSGEASPLLQPLKRISFYGRTTYDITDNITAYAQVLYTSYTSQVRRFGFTQGTVRDVYIPVTNPYVPADLASIIASRPNPTDPLLFYFNGGRFAPEIYHEKYDVAQYLGGLTGKLGILDATWDLYGSYGRTDQNEDRTGYADRNAYVSLINAPDGGSSLCTGGLNPFIIAPVSQSCLTYLERSLKERTTLEQTVIEGSMQGRIVNLPAGEARFALGTSYRRNSYSFSPDAQRLTGAVLGTSISAPSSGAVSTKEVFAELLLPLIHNTPFIKELNVDLAYRYSDYNTVGGVSTYKGSVDWELNSAFRVRGGYQRAIRAPAVGELFAPREQSSATVGRTAAGQGDPCDFTSIYRAGANGASARTLCIANGVPAALIDSYRFTGSASASMISGNRDLKEETADTFTGGVVFRSPGGGPLIKHFSASVDYYKIKLKDAIGLITGDVIVQRCFNGDGSNPTYDANNYYCKLISRNPSGGFANIDTPQLNLAGYKSSGVDLQIDWRLDAGDVAPSGWGGLGINFLLSYTGEYAIQSLAGAKFVNYAGTIGNAQISADAISHPKWKTTTTFDYVNGPVTVDLRWRWIDKMGNSGNVGTTNGTAPGVTDRSYFDLTGRVRIIKGLEIRGGILNLTDKQPPEWTGEGATDFAIYDVLGRRYFIGANVKF